MPDLQTPTKKHAARSQECIMTFKGVNDLLQTY